MRGGRAAAAAEGERLWVDADKVSVALVTAAEESVAAERAPKVAKKGAEEDVAAAGKSSPVKEGVSPIPLAKAIKNEAELEGMFEAHYRDGVAMASFWCWLDKQAALGKTHDEYEIGEVVSSFRAKQPGFSEESFATIAGEGPHGAIIHYRATKESARVVGPDSLLLCDSGGQYDCGTTDVTRTHHPEADGNQKEAYTRVLQGHIGSPVVFPRTRAGSCWTRSRRTSGRRAGLPSRHRTRRGGGAQRARGPGNISPDSGTPRSARNGAQNEPGYYEAGGFGIASRTCTSCARRRRRTPSNKKYLKLDC